MKVIKCVNYIIQIKRKVLIFPGNEFNVHNNISGIYLCEEATGQNEKLTEAEIFKVKRNEIRLRKETQ